MFMEKKYFESFKIVCINSVFKTDSRNILLDMQVMNRSILNSCIGIL
jgi:hypothetical protein